MLFLVYREYKKRIYTLSREHVIELFTEYLESMGELAWQVEEEGDWEDAAKSARERAFQLLRRLLDTGWLNLEPESDYTFRISIPDYAIVILEAMNKIRTGYRVEFKGRILSIYQNLTGSEWFSYIALQQAYESTRELIDGLKSLNHSIKNYTEKLLETEDVRAILSQIFDEYQTKVLGAQYYRLKTSEHISKYRIGILKRIREWNSNRAEIVNQAGIMVQEKRAPDRVTAENMLYEWVEYIESSFGQEMDRLLGEIDRRNARYARSAADRLRFKLHQGRGAGQHIFTVLAYLGQLAKGSGEKSLAPEEVARSIALFPQTVVDSQSLRKPPAARQAHNPQLLRVFSVPDEIRREKLFQFGSRVAEEVTVEQINNYVDSLLDEQDVCPLERVPLENRNQWVKLIYIILYSQSPGAGYRLEGKRGETVAIKGGTVEVPNLVIKRKEKKS
ncbi:Wadjet anti-phage system protein JetA family protein [Desulfoscipio geothermicus]|uniref:Wadjet anti-phage system protein JetA family protein n=1 Tax=Desulfoscipio geothermicus TaxID=39060 RepID=UPI0010423EA3|nr:Wadjet anti-phage system protein JetA family protein [Desulfoscipio geothermicus]